MKKEFFTNFSFYKKSNSIWGTSQETKKYDNCKTQGIRALRDTNLGKKPTTYFLQLIGEKIQKNIYELSQKEFNEIILNREVRKKQEFGYGYIAFRYKNKIIGCGLQDREGIKTQIPKGRTNILKNYNKKPI